MSHVTSSSSQQQQAQDKPKKMRHVTPHTARVTCHRQQQPSQLLLLQAACMCRPPPPLSHPVAWFGLRLCTLACCGVSVLESIEVAASWKRYTASKTTTENALCPPPTPAAVTQPPSTCRRQLFCVFIIASLTKTLCPALSAGPRALGRQSAVAAAAARSN
jgi:hypothetical protein